MNEDARSPDASEAFARLAVFEKQAGNNDASIQFFEKSIAAKRTAANAAQASSLYFANGNYQQAVAEYESLDGLNDADSSMLRSGRISVIIALYRSNKSKEAEHNIAEFLKVYGSDNNDLAEFEFEQAMALYRAGESDRALAILRAFPVKYDSTEILPQACFSVGKILQNKEYFPTALYTTSLRRSENSLISFMATVRISVIILNFLHLQSA